LHPAARHAPVVRHAADAATCPLHFIAIFASSPPLRRFQRFRRAVAADCDISIFSLFLRRMPIFDAAITFSPGADAANAIFLSPYAPVFDAALMRLP